MRTDIHTPNKIIPEDYTHVIDYQGATTIDGWPVPSYGINCELDHIHKDENGNIVKGKHSEDGHCCVVGLILIAKVKWGGNGGTLKCSVCGTRYIYGEVWKHNKTGEYIHVGHVCAEKYGMIADHSPNYQNKKAVFIANEIKKQQRKQLINDYPELTEEMLNKDNKIVKDIMNRYYKWNNISEKQVALIVKIYNQKDEDFIAKAIAPPTGNIEFTGKILSVKEKFTDYGMAHKVLIKVKKDDSYWIAYGTLPKKYVGQDVKGKTVNVKTKLYNDYQGVIGTMSRPKIQMV